MRPPSLPPQAPLARPPLRGEAINRRRGGVKLRAAGRHGLERVEGPRRRPAGTSGVVAVKDPLMEVECPTPNLSSVCIGAQTDTKPFFAKAHRYTDFYHYII